MIEIGLIGCVALYKILVKSYILLVGLEDYHMLSFFIITKSILFTGRVLHFVFSS